MCYFISLQQTTKLMERLLLLTALLAVLRTLQLVLGTKWYSESIVANASIVFTALVQKQPVAFKRQIFLYGALIYGIGIDQPVNEVSAFYTHMRMAIDEWKLTA